MYLTGRCLFLNCGRMAAPTLNVSLHSFSWSEGEGSLESSVIASHSSLVAPSLPNEDLHHTVSSLVKRLLRKFHALFLCFHEAHFS